MATRRSFCFIEAGVTPMACSRNHVAWSKRETYMREFIWLAKSYSEASTAPLNVCTQSAMICLSLFVLRRKLLPGNSFSYPRHKLRHPIQRSFRLVAVRRMLAVREHQDLRRWHARLCRLHLRDRSVLVLFALNAQDGTPDRRQIFFDVPRSKLRIEPDIVPSPKRCVHLLVVASQLLRQVGRLVVHLRLRDAGHAEVLDKHVRRFQNHRARPLRILPGKDERDRSTIAVPQQDRPHDAELVEQLW